MDRLFSILFLLGGIAVGACASDTGEASPFSLTFLPGAVEPMGFEDTPEGQQSLGGFNLGYHSQEEGSDLGWYSNVNVTEYQTLLTAGASAVLLEKDSLIVSGQLLGGYAFGHDDFVDSWHGTFDLFGATPLGKSESHFIKFGAFVDLEEDFGKWGPQAGLLLGADRKHPVTLDAAYGRGIGDPVRKGQSIWTVAQDDFQLRAGVFLTENLQVGISGQYQVWDDLLGREEDWKTGGFVSWFSGEGHSISLGMASGEHGSNGFASFSYVPGKRFYSAVPGGKGGKELVVSSRYSPSRSWMVAPVRRLHTVGVRQESVTTTQPQTQAVPIGGTLTGTFFVAGDPFTLIGTPGDQLRVTYTNTTGTAQNVTIVSIEQFNQTVQNVGSTSSVAPGATVTAATPPAGGVGVPGTPPWIQTVVISINGQSFSVDLTFPAGVANGYTTAPVMIGP